MSHTSFKPRRSKTTPVPVRMDRATLERLDSAAPRLGGNRATLVRLAIRKLLDEVETGRVSLN